jgi:hypothetical protein
VATDIGASGVGGGPMSDLIAVAYPDQQTAELVRERLGQRPPNE